MEYNNYLGWIYPKTQDLVNTQDVENIIYLQKGNNGGLATLDGSGKVPTSQLPSYVDDVLEFETKYDFPSRGEEGKIYVDADSNYTYRWTGNTYILIGGLQNLVDGTSIGSIRNVSAVQEDGNYSLGASASALGENSSASGSYAFAEGYQTEATGQASHAEGGGTTASGEQSHAEGGGTTASGSYSHAEGEDTTASKTCAHAEGYETIASGYNSHAEGNNTTASSTDAHAEGAGTTASGENSHAGGTGTTAQRKSQTTIGEYNILDSSGTTTTRGDYAFIIGNGSSSSTRSNALTVKWDGVVESSGTPTANNHLTTKQYVDNAISSSIVFFTATMVNDTPTVTFTYNQVKNSIDANKLAFIKLQYTESEEDYSGTFCDLMRITGYSTTTLEGVSLYRVFTDGEMEFNAATATAVMTYQVSSGQTDPDPADRDPNDFQ